MEKPALDTDKLESMGWSEPLPSFPVELLLCIDSSPRLHALQIPRCRPIHIRLSPCITVLPDYGWDAPRKFKPMLEDHQGVLCWTPHSHPVQISQQADHVSPQKRNTKVTWKSWWDPACGPCIRAFMVNPYGSKLGGTQTNSHVVEIQRSHGAAHYPQQGRGCISTGRSKEVHWCLWKYAVSPRFPCKSFCWGTNQPFYADIKMPHATTHCSFEPMPQPPTCALSMLY